MYGLGYKYDQTWSVRTAPILWLINTLAPSWQILYPKVLEYPSGWLVPLCLYAPMLILELSLSGFLTVSDQGSLTTIGELLNISALDPLLPTFLIATLCLCILSIITYHSLVLAWDVFWASWQSPLLLDPSAEVVLTKSLIKFFLSVSEKVFCLQKLFCALCASKPHLLWGLGSVAVFPVIKCHCKNCSFGQHCPHGDSEGQ